MLGNDEQAKSGWQQPDLVVLNGKIATMDPVGHSVEALAVAKGRVVALGTTAEISDLAGPDSRRFDCEGRRVLPGIIDSHCHPDMYGARIGRWVDLSWPNVRGNDELLALISKTLEGRPKGEWFAGYRFDDVKLGGYPSRDALDQAADGRPVFIYRTDGHLGLANSPALRACGFDEGCENPPFGHLDRDPESGRLTGLLRESAALRFVDRIQAETTSDDIADGLKRVFAEAHRYGITSLHNSLTTRDGLAAYQKLRGEDALNMRMGIIASGREEGMVEGLIAGGLRSGFGDEWLRLIGVEWCPDCSTSGRTAAYYEPYVGTAVTGEPADNRGMLLYEREDFNERVRAAHAAGLMVCADGVGDRGIDFVLDAYEAALAKHPRADHRMRVEHCCYVTPEIRARIKKLGVIASSATGFAYDLGDAYIQNRGEAAMRHMWPHRSMNADGIIAPGHSDAPICHPNPLRGIYSMVQRKTDSGASLCDDEGVSVWDAIAAYTTLGAYVGWEENLKGSLTPGKLADLCILERDILEGDPEGIATAEVHATILGGEVVYRAS